MTDNNPSAADMFGQIADEFVSELRQGRHPTVEEFVRRHPNHADEIREFLPALVMIEKAKESDTSRPRSRTDASDTAPPIKQLGDYQILREVARGGMGVVYEAEQLSLGRHVAIKVLSVVARLDSRQLGRFQREARSAARLHHTNIVPVFGVGEQDGLHYYVMQFIQGLGLDLVLDELRRLRQPSSKQASTPGSERAARKTDETPYASAVAAALLSGEFKNESPAVTDTTEPPDASPMASLTIATGSASTVRASSNSSANIRMPGQPDTSTLSESGTQYWLSVARVGLQVADALAYAANQGVLHRDIKPSNLLLDDGGNVWVTDFGLAKATTDGDDLTHTGDVVGTLRYMAPERFNGRGDIRSDVYSLGLTLFELLTLRPAFDETDRNKLVKRLMHDAPVQPRKLNPGVPRDLETVVLKAIARNPAHRYQTPAEMAEDLKRFVEDRPVRARRTSEAEKLWRWCRRNPGISALGGALSAVLLLATIASLLAAGHFNQLRLNEAQSAQNERDARQEADLARQAAASQRQLALTEKNRADITLADMYASRGLLAGERDTPAEAALWFAAASEQSTIAEDPQRQYDNLLRARNWIRRATLPVSAIQLPGAVNHLEFQPNGDQIRARFGKDEMTIWCWRDGKRLPWTEKLVGVGSAQFSPDGASVALGFQTGEIHICNVADGEVLAKIPHKGPISALGFSPDGRYLVFASNAVRIWDIEKQVLLETKWDHPQAVKGLTFTRKGDRLITTCADSNVRVFLIGSKTDRNEPAFGPMPHLALSPPALIDEDRTLVTVTGGSELTQWDMATGKPETAPIRTQPRSLQGVAASLDGKWFASGGYNGPELFATDSKRPPINLSHTNLVKRIEFSPDNAALLSVSMDQTARLWSLPDGQPIGDPLRQMAIADNCAWSQDGRVFATTQYDGLVRVWQRPEDDRVKVQEPKWGQRPRISFDGRLVVPSIWHESALGGIHQNVNSLRVLTSDGFSVAADLALRGPLIDSCICGDNLAAAAVYSQGAKARLGVWDVKTARQRFEPIELAAVPISIAARPSHGQLAVLCTKGELLIFDDQTGNCVLRLHHEAASATPAGRSIRVEYTSDGKSLVSLAGAQPHSINVRDADTGKLRFALRPSVEGANFHSFCLSADGKMLAAYTLVKNSVQVWDIETGRPLSEPLLHPGDYWGIFSVRFSPDGQRLLTSHKDGQVRYWDWKAGKLACPPMAHEDETHDAMITPDGRYALTAMSGRPEIHFWELKTGRRVAPPVRLGLSDRGFCLRFALSPDGRRLFVCFFGGASDTNLAVVDLDSILSPSRVSSADLALLAELTMAQRIELGDLSGLTIDQWLDRWNRLSERHDDRSRFLAISPKTKSK